MYLFTKRIFDLFVSFLLLIILSPLFLLLSIFIVVNSGFPVFYGQIRVGKNYRQFMMWKFRTMKSGSDEKGLLTVGIDDSRITSEGKFLRRFKLDELPQLLNVLSGEMSLVGPRPEVPKYVAMYNDDQKKVLDVIPGITDSASLQYFTENKILGDYKNPEEGYIKEIMPKKLAINLKYLENRSFSSDLRIILKTIARIFY